MKRVLLEYRVLALKMHLDASTQLIAKAILNLLCEVELLLVLTCILPLLEALNYLIKFSLQTTCFVCDMWLRQLSCAKLTCFLGT